ncbi:MAG: GTPase HflX [Longimicrobiales bacterium]
MPGKDIAASEAHEHLRELERLTDTAGGVVQDALQQRLESPHPRTYIGEGKVAQLKERIAQTRADLVIFDEDLSPAQGKNLEDELGTRVMDRTELILDIFATRARSAEAQVQVELAQLQYLLPRLKRMWTHLSRISGGIGARGPGETQLETDRRLIGKRIRDLKRRLEIVARQRATQRKARTHEFRAAIVGYTNAGKSSILRALSGADVRVEDRLFATLDPATRAVGLGSGSRVLVTDTVGFIRRLPHNLVASFRATLEETASADLLLHVIDASHPSWEEQKRVAEEVLRELGAAGPAVLVFNKLDRLTHGEEELLRQRVRARDSERAVFVSTVEPDGLVELTMLLDDELRRRRPEVHVMVPSADGEALASIYREGVVLRREERGTSIDLVARVPRATLGRLQRRSGVVVNGVG